MATGYFSHPDCLAHDMGAGHPECAQRIHAIEDQLRAHGLDAFLIPGEVPLASNDDLALAHDLNYVLHLDDFLQHLEASGDTRALDPDTWACPGTRSAAWRAAGAAVAATDAVLDGKLNNAFCAVRPPGHHALHNQTMGFCFSTTWRWPRVMPSTVEASSAWPSWISMSTTATAPKTSWLAMTAC